MPFVESHDARIYYETCGADDAPVLVFAHGRGGNAASWWQQVAYFAHRYRVIVFDHRAFGRSTCPPGGFQVRYFVDDLKAILAAEGAHSVALVCQSMGGWTGLRFAALCPDRVRCLVLANTPGGISTDALREHEKARIEITGNVAFDNRALAPDYHVRQATMGYLYNQISAFNTGGGAAAWSALSPAERDLDRDLLAGYATPTMMITGEQDRIFPRALLHEVAPLIPGCGLCDLATVGHSAYFEDAAAFNAVLDEFLSRHHPCPVVREVR